MNEKLTRRIGRIFSSSLNALLDALDNTGPEAVMEKNIRKIDDAIDEARSELGKLSADRHLSGKDLAKAEQKCAELVKKSELAVGQGRDAIAEKAVSELLDMEAEISALKRYISGFARVEKELELYIHDLQDRRRRMVEQLRRHREKEERGMDAGSLPRVETDTGKGAGRAQEIKEHMQKYKTGRWETGNRDKTGPEADLAEVDRIYRKHMISERLSEIKKRMKKGEP